MAPVGASGESLELPWLLVGNRRPRVSGREGADSHEGHRGQPVPRRGAHPLGVLHRDPAVPSPLRGDQPCPGLGRAPQLLRGTHSLEPGAAHTRPPEGWVGGLRGIWPGPGGATYPSPRVVSVRAGRGTRSSVSGTGKVPALPVPEADLRLRLRARPGVGAGKDPRACPQPLWSRQGPTGQASPMPGRKGKPGTAFGGDGRPGLWAAWRGPIVEVPSLLARPVPGWLMSRGLASWARGSS